MSRTTTVQADVERGGPGPDRGGRATIGYDGYLVWERWLEFKTETDALVAADMILRLLTVNSSATVSIRPRSYSIEFEAYHESVPLARHRTRSFLAEWGLSELSGDAEIVVTKLVENAIQATVAAGLGAPIRLTLLAGLRTVLVVVRDGVPDPSVPRQPATGIGDLALWTGDDDADPDQHGKGLLIVEALTAHWDWKPSADGGKVVRALIRAASAADSDTHDQETRTREKDILS